MLKPLVEPSLDSPPAAGRSTFERNVLPELARWFVGRLEACRPDFGEQLAKLASRHDLGGRLEDAVGRLRMAVISAGSAAAAAVTRSGWRWTDRRCLPSGPGTMTRRSMLVTLDAFEQASGSRCSEPVTQTPGEVIELAEIENNGASMEPWSIDAQAAVAAQARFITGVAAELLDAAAPIPTDAIAVAPLEPSGGVAGGAKPDPERAPGQRPAVPARMRSLPSKGWPTCSSSAARRSRSSYTSAGANATP